MARRKEPENPKKICKPKKEQKLRVRAWDHLTARIPGIPHTDKPASSKPASDKAPPTREWKLSAADDADLPGNRQLHARNDDPAIAEWYRMYDQEYGPPTQVSARYQEPPRQSHKSSQKTKAAKTKTDSPDSVEFLYERSKRKLSRVESPEDEGSHRK